MKRFIADSTRGHPNIGGRFIRFSIVGGSGVLVDMLVLYLLASSDRLGWNVSLSKAIAAEVAIANNYLWNDCWTFRDALVAGSSWGEALARFGRFNLICLTGLLWSVLLLNLQMSVLHANLWLANLVAIALVSLWNFGWTQRMAWKVQSRRAGPSCSSRF